MKRVLPVERPWPLHQRASSQRIERQALTDVAPHTLMQRAGLAAARLARALCPHGHHAWVAAGPGNNGGDGLEAAAQLKALGWQVTVSLLADAARLPADATEALSRAQAASVSIVDQLPAGQPDIALDALLGLGTTRAPDGRLAEAIRLFNALPCPRLAIDVPSGLNVDNGQPWGDACVTATHTLSLLTLKPGLFTGAGRDHSGEVWFDDLGVPDDPAPPEAWLSGTAPPQMPRHHAQHKGSFGDVAVVGGASGMGGAVLLAARAALSAGAGRVYVDALGEGAPSVDTTRPELMFRPGWHLGDAAVLKSSTVVCGCGGGDAVRHALPRLLSLAGRLVLDADALNALATDSALQALLRARPAGSTVMTPHPLEAARLLGVRTGDAQADRLQAAQQLAQRHGCVVVLKGSGSVVAAPDTTPVINATGNAALASAGTGDVLAGWIGGEWAAETNPKAGGDPPQAAPSAADRAGALGPFTIVQRVVALHGHAADLAPTAPLRASMLIEVMHQARR